MGTEGGICRLCFLPPRLLDFAAASSTTPYIDFLSGLPLSSVSARFKALCLSLPVVAGGLAVLPAGGIAARPGEAPLGTVGSADTAAPPSTTGRKPFFSCSPANRRNKLLMSTPTLMAANSSSFFAEISLSFLSSWSLVA